MFKKAKEKRIEAQDEAKKTITTNSKTAQQRMKIDIQNYNSDKIQNVIIAFPKGEDLVTQLIIKIMPNKQRSFYRNSLISFSFTATEEYPYKPPVIKCLNKILHPNIDKNGNVCLSILRSGWKPIYELYQVTVGLLHLLQNIKAADIEEPLDNDAALLMNKDTAEFDKVVQQTIKGKSYFNRQFDNVYYVHKK